MKPVICILHYGDASRTAKLYEALRCADNDIPVLVLDNAAPEPFPGAWVRLPENLYWAGALAWCLTALAQEGYSHVWFCNNDIMPVSSPPYLRRLLARLSHLERMASLASLDSLDSLDNLDNQAKLQKSGKVGLISPSFTANPYHAHMVQRPGGQCALAVYVDGIAPLISLECVREIGGLDFGENIYGYGVDIWLSYRAWRAGFGVFVDDSLLFRHQYHTEALKKDGFMAVAAKAEDSYMSARLGNDWRDKILSFQQESLGAL